MHWAVILAGGSGTRFWPLSSPARPKQILPLAGDRSSAEEAVRRLAGLIPLDRVLLVTGRALAAPLAETLGLPPENVLVEPFPRSTAPALAWATHEAGRRDPEAVVLSLHADWHVPDPAGFVTAAERALATAATRPVLVTVGVVPTRPETGYGYIVPGPAVEGGPPEVRTVERFTEKPDAATAEALIAGGALWNSGIFAWSAGTLRDELSRHTPEIAVGFPALEGGDVAAFFDAVRAVSIDVGLLERSRSVVVVPGRFHWDDIGTWEALARVRLRDAQGNVLVGPVTAIDSTDSIVWTEGVPVVLNGVRNLIVVEANGRLLVMDRSQAADLKRTLEHLPPEVRDL